jgi:hypothetical protein
MRPKPLNFSISGVEMINGKLWVFSTAQVSSGEGGELAGVKAD